MRYASAARQACGVVVVFVMADFADGEVVHERPAKSLGALPRRRGSLGPPASAKAGPAGARAVAAVSAAGCLCFLEVQLPQSVFHNCKRSGAETATAAPKGCPGKAAAVKIPGAQGERTTEQAKRSFIRMAGYNLFSLLATKHCLSQTPPGRRFVW